MVHHANQFLYKAAITAKTHTTCTCIYMYMHLHVHAHTRKYTSAKFNTTWKHLLQDTVNCFNITVKVRMYC